MKSKFHSRFTIREGDKVVWAAAKDAKPTMKWDVVAVSPQNKRVYLVEAKYNADMSKPINTVGAISVPIADVMIWDTKMQRRVPERVEPKKFVFARRMNAKRIAEEQTLSAVAKVGFINAAYRSMQAMGYAVVAQDGWVVKINEQGEVIERMSKLAVPDTNVKTRLD